MTTMRPGRIQRKDIFLWQEDTPSGAGMNLWSGLLSANNGYPREHALKAAVLFEASPDLLQALQGMLAIHDSVTQGQEQELREKWIPLARAAIAKATGSTE